MYMVSSTTKQIVICSWVEYTLSVCVCVCVCVPLVGEGEMGEGLDPLSHGGLPQKGTYCIR